jgi:hypothetical protein
MGGCTVKSYYIAQEENKKIAIKLKDKSWHSEVK